MSENNINNTECIYNCELYLNDGNEFMSVNGKKINLSATPLFDELVYTGELGNYRNKYANVSSIDTVTIDGKQIENNGSTIIFAEEGLSKDIDFLNKNISLDDTPINGINKNISLDDTPINGIINKNKNEFKYSTVVVIQSQSENLICACSGKNVSSEVCTNIPRTIKITIDGKNLYVHRGMYQIINKTLLD